MDQNKIVFVCFSFIINDVDARHFFLLLFLFHCEL